MLELSYKAVRCYEFQISDFSQTAILTQQPSLPVAVISL